MYLVGLSMAIINSSRKAVSDIVVGQTVLYLQMRSKQVKMQMKKGSKQKRSQRIERGMLECRCLKDRMRN